VGNSGTTLYLLTSAAALSDREISFTGDSQIQRRSAAQLLHSLSDLGAGVNVAKNNGCAPYTIKGPLKGGKTSIECPTSQFLSSLLIACPLADGNTEIQVPLLHEKPYAEMTLRWLDDQFVMYENKNFSSFFIPGGQKYRPFSKPVPADFSSATFFLCAAAITRSKLRLKNLDMKDSQGDKEVVRILEKMGCAVSFDGMDIIIEGRPMQGIDIDLNSMPDALPALAAAACFAEGTTRLLNVPQARMKETDRIAVMFSELLKMGADITELPDGLVIKKSSLKGTEVHGHDDHRVVMALAIAGLGADGVTVIGTAEAAAVTFPGFFETLESIKV
jgi:3-phosphoshikimate 1-carboxyvinyltransferase